MKVLFTTCQVTVFRLKNWDLDSDKRVLSPLPYIRGVQPCRTARPNARNHLVHGPQLHMCQEADEISLATCGRLAILFYNLDFSSGHKISAPGQLLARGPRVEHVCAIPMRFPFTVQFNLFLHPDHVKKTWTVAIVIWVTAPPSWLSEELMRVSGLEGTGLTVCFLKRVHCVTIHDKVRSFAFRKALNVKPLLLIERLQLRWFDRHMVLDFENEDLLLIVGTFVNFYLQLNMKILVPLIQKIQIPAKCPRKSCKIQTGLVRCNLLFWVTHVQFHQRCMLFLQNPVWNNCNF